eukprot:3919253-Prymnesium_polylepis.1
MASNLVGVMLYELLSHTTGPRTSLRVAAIVVALGTASSDILDAVAGPSRWYVCFVASAFGVPPLRT